MSRILTWALSGTVAAAVAAFAPPACAAAQEAPEKIATVRYSYEGWSAGGAKRYVLIPQSVEIRPGPFKDRMRALFESVRSAKSNTYGAAKVAFQDDADKTGEVYVWLDAQKGEYNAIVMAETTYTFTENGARRVRFPKVQDNGWTRADVPNSAFVLDVPLVEVLPPVELPGALVNLPDGTVVPFAVVSDKLKAYDRAMVDAMWTYVTNGPASATLLAIEAGRRLALPDLEARVLPSLDSANPEIRGAALNALDGHDNPTVDAAIRKVLDEDPDATIQDKASMILSRSKDPTYSTAAQYHALKSKDPNVVAAAATGLGDSKQPEAGTQLLAILGRPEANIRGAALASVIKRGDLSALAQQLGDQKLDAAIRLEVGVALAKTSDATAHLTGLAYVAVNGKAGVSSDAATDLGKIDEPASYDALGKALAHAEPQTRIAAAKSLGLLAQPRALPLLAKAKVDDPDSGPAAIDAIRAIYAGQKSEMVLKACKDPDAVLRKVAVATLGELVKRGSRSERKQIIEVLRTLAGDSRPAIRASAVRSFGDMGGDDVKGDVVKLAADGEIEVQRSTAAALGAFPGKETIKLLLGFAQQQDAELLANAITSLGVLQEREALDPVVTRLAHDDVRVRRAATAALVKIGQTVAADKRAPMLQYFSERLFDADASVRLSALEGLTLVKDPRVVAAMAALVQDPVTEVRKATLLSMAATGDASAVEGIASGLDDDHPEVRKTALEAFRRLKRKEAVSVLSGYVKKEQDKALADEAGKLLQSLKGG